MRSINLNRQLVGIEDLLIGFGTVIQTRGGQQTLVTKINAGSLPFDETQSLLQWAQTLNLAELGAIVDELTIVANNKDSIVAVSNNSVNINLVAGLNDEIASLYANLIAIQSNYANITTLIDIHNNMANLLLIASQIIPNITEILNVDVLSTQVANDKAAVETMKLAVETIYDTFDDRFLGSKVNDPTVDNDGNALIDGAMYFNTSSNAIKVYDLGNTLWVTIPQIYLSGLLDVQLTSIATGDILTWNGTKWVNTRTPSFDSIKLNGGTSTQGTATWNNTDLTYDLVLNDNVTLQVGQEEVIYCKNNTLTTLPNGRPVMAVGTNGNSGNILVELHDGTKASAKRIIGLTTQPILPINNINPYGFVTRNGKVRGLNTTGSDYGETWAEGDILYVKATGALTKVEPADTALKMPIAFVIHAHTNGTLYVRTTGIDENHDRDLIATKLSKVASTDNAIVRFNGPNGDVQNSGVTIDDSGNVGIGVGTVNSTLPTIIGNYLMLTGMSESYLMSNSFYQSGVYKYFTNNLATNFYMSAGKFYWDTAFAGTAGSAISFTTKMTLDKDGVLLLKGANGGLGYGAGAGGTVTQLTSKATTVTLNKPSGRIIMHDESLAAGATVYFILNNNLLEIGDTAVITNTSLGAYDIRVGIVTTGFAVIYVTNTTSTPYSHAIPIIFSIIKGAIS